MKYNKNNNSITYIVWFHEKSLSTYYMCHVRKHILNVKDREYIHFALTWKLQRSQLLNITIIRGRDVAQLNTVRRCT